MSLHISISISSDALHVDPYKTLSTYHEQIHQNAEALLEAEVIFLKEGKFDVVIVDATALACMAAKRASIPCILLTNFTWDAIYRGILCEIKDQLPAETCSIYEAMIESCTEQYRCASYYFQLPGEMDPPLDFLAPITPLPLACRHNQVPREVILERYKISPEKNIVILGFGGQKSDASWRIKDSMLPENWVGLLLGATKSMLDSAASDELEACKNIICIPQDEYIPDLINAASCVIGKVGYGTVSECLYHGTPLIFIPRTYWPEGPPLERLLLKFNAGIRMSEEDFFGGKWGEYLAHALSVKNNWRTELSEQLNPEGALDFIYREIIKAIKS